MNECIPMKSKLKHLTGFLLVLLSLLACSFSSPSAAMTFKYEGNGGNCNECEWIAADGMIDTTTPAEFDRFLTDNFGPNTENQELRAVRFIPRVFLNSGGGDLKAGLELGRLFRKNKVSVGVGRSDPPGVDNDNPGARELGDGVCVSACAYAFLGGAEREVPSGGRLGFHQFFSADVIDKIAEPAFTGMERLQDQFAAGVIVKYLMEMDINTELYPLVAGTSPGEMRYLSTLELENLRVNSGSDSFGQWNLVPFSNGVVAEIAKPSGRTKIRLYCATKRSQAHLTYIRLNENKESRRDDPWPREILSAWPLVLSVESKRWPVKFNTLDFSQDMSRMFLVFNIPTEALEEIIKKKVAKLEPDGGSDRANQGFFDDLDIKFPEVDQRYFRIIMNNCI